MRIEEHNGVHLIFEDENESLWRYQVIDPSSSKVYRPKLKSFLKEWWDVTAPGQWTTTYMRRSERAIIIRDARLFQLFKLAWAGRPEIERPSVRDAAFVYCPYIPLSISTPLLTPKSVLDEDNGLDGANSE